MKARKATKRLRKSKKLEPTKPLVTIHKVVDQSSPTLVNQVATGKHI
ncbi:MAG TPA: hypothetical protein VMH00_00765 [Candidatus Limnocylindrales bacterium]|nr:hypothetical protein [Candidatus Limnocylindrales bacterium]